MLQVILTIIFYALMVGILTLVGLMYRTSMVSRRKTDQTLIDAAMLSAEAAHKAAEAAQKLATMLERAHHAD